MDSEKKRFKFRTPEQPFSPHYDEVLNDPYESNRERIAAAQEANNATARAFRRVFLSEDGVKVLQMLQLEAKVGKDILAPNDGLTTGRNIGRREMVELIEMWLEYPLHDNEHV